MDNFPLFSFGKKEETEGKKKVLQALKALRDGEQVKGPIDCKLQGLDREIVDVLNDIIAQHQACEAEFARVAQETEEGKAPRVRFDSPGTWLNIAWSVDKILQSHAEQVHQFNEAIKEIAKGDFSRKSTSNIKGSPFELKTIDLLADNLSSFTSEIKRLAVLEGRGEQASVQQYGGSWRNTIESVNDLHLRLSTLYESATSKLNGKLDPAGIHSIAGVQKIIEQIPANESRELALQNFVACFSNEVRTPLNAIVGFAGLLAESDLTDEQKEYAACIKTSGMVLIEVVNDLLDFHRGLSGKIIVHESPFSLRQSCEYVLCELSNKPRSVVLNLDIDQHLPDKLLGDGELFTKMLRHVVAQTNYAYYGEVLVAIKELSREGETLCVEISINHEGRGYSEDRIRQIMSLDSDAVGYGHLAVALRLIKSLNGKCAVESTDTNGTTITISVPLKIDPNGTSSERIPADLVQREILVACTNSATQHVLARTIAGLGIIPISVSSYDNAMELLQKPTEKGYIAVLVDGDDEAFKKIVEFGTNHSATPILVMSSNREVAWPKSTKRLEKPVGPFRLLQALRDPHDALRIDGLRSDAPRTVSVQVHPQHAYARILFAATNAMNRKVYEKILTKMGCKNVVVVETGAAAVKELETSAYDMIFLDSIEDALETTKIIRADHGARIRIIGVTANPKLRDAYIDAGMDDHITKPVSLKALADVIARVLPIITEIVEERVSFGENASDEGIDGEFVIVGNK